MKQQSTAKNITSTSLIESVKKNFLKLYGNNPDALNELLALIPTFTAKQLCEYLQKNNNSTPERLTSIELNTSIVELYYFYKAQNKTTAQSSNTERPIISGKENQPLLNPAKIHTGTENRYWQDAIKESKQTTSNNQTIC